MKGGGGSQPLGLVNLPIGSASGSNLALSGVVAVEKTVADAGAPDTSTAGGLAATDAASTLKQRARITSTNETLWQGALLRGQLEGAPAMTSINMPAGTLLHGVWSELLIAEWAPGVILSNATGRSGHWYTWEAHKTKFHAWMAKRALDERDVCRLLTINTLDDIQPPGSRSRPHRRSR